ncbi:uncharacterized protein ISCGN_023943 [Ixodes scapularis]
MERTRRENLFLHQEGGGLGLVNIVLKLHVQRFLLFRDAKDPNLLSALHHLGFPHLGRWMVTTSGRTAKAAALRFYSEIAASIEFFLARFSWDYLATVGKRKLYWDTISVTFPSHLYRPPPVPDGTAGLFKLVRRLPVSAASKDFFVRMHLEVLPVKTWLHRRGIFVPWSLNCDLCGATETIQHVLVECSNAYLFWDEMRTIFNLRTAFDVEWLSALNRKDFTPTEHTRVCSAHFVAGEKTDENIVPQLSLGYARKVVVGRRRLVRDASCEPLTTKRKKLSSGAGCGISSDSTAEHMIALASTSALAAPEHSSTSYTQVVERVIALASTSEPATEHTSTDSTAEHKIALASTSGPAAPEHSSTSSTEEVECIIALASISEPATSEHSSTDSSQEVEQIISLASTSGPAVPEHSVGLIHNLSDVSSNRIYLMQLIMAAKFGQMCAARGSSGKTHAIATTPTRNPKLQLRLLLFIVAIALRIETSFFIPVSMQTSSRSW